MRPHFQRLALTAAAFLALVCASLPALATELHHSAVRLLAGPAGPEATKAGVEITLEQGWKTYWRMPGESGVPPDFDWSRSHNVEAVEVAYPAPHRFTDSGGESIGYKSRVVFPVTVRPKQAGQPIDLRLTLHYAVCMDICVPASTELERRLGDGAPPAAEVDAIHEAESLVPAPEVPGLALRHARLEAGEGHSLVVTLSGEAAGGEVDILVEGYDDAYFRAPERLGREGADSTFALAIDGLRKPGTLKGATLTLTVLAGNVRLVRAIRVE